LEDAWAGAVSATAASAVRRNVFVSFIGQVRTRPPRAKSRVVRRA
jgi:hypothetical protein